MNNYPNLIVDLPDLLQQLRAAEVRQPQVDEFVARIAQAQAGHHVLHRVAQPRAERCLEGLARHQRLQHRGAARQLLHLRDERQLRGRRAERYWHGAAGAIDCSEWVGIRPARRGDQHGRDSAPLVQVVAEIVLAQVLVRYSKS